MRSNLKLILALCFYSLISLACTNSVADIRDARVCADTFHKNFRAQSYDAIFLDASQRFRDVRPRADYLSMMKEIQGEYGRLINAQEVSSATVINTEAGKAQVFIFNLEFEKAKATERLTFTRDNNGQMRLWMFELS
jgi:hypothetical protein